MEEVIQTSGNINIWISYYPAIGEYDKLHLDAIDLGYKLISVVINIMDCIFSCIAHHNFSYYWSSTIVVLSKHTHIIIVIIIIMFGIKIALNCTITLRYMSKRMFWCFVCTWVSWLRLHIRWWLINHAKKNMRGSNRVVTLLSCKEYVTSIRFSVD